MNFDFDTIKLLFDIFDIINKDNKYVILNKIDKTEYDFNSYFAQKIQFAYTWVFATRYDPSNLEKMNNSLTKEEYQKAFSDEAKLIYDTIIQKVVINLQTLGIMYQEESLIKEVIKEIPSFNSTNIIKGLYANPDGYKAFVYWAKDASEFELTKEEDIPHRKK